MDKDQAIKNLNHLVQLDIDAVHAYEQALKNIEVPAIHDQLSKFRDDHKRHIEELTSEIRALGGTPPEDAPDFKGQLISGFTAMRSSIGGTEGALKAMKTNEKLTNKNYDEAMTWSLPDSAKAIVTKGFNDERIHLDYIERTLDKRTWEGLEDSSATSTVNP
ncbi:DUF2383 domain-containing protein [Desulfonatronum parangueonense]